MSRVRLEVCCGSADDVIQAHRAGADRVELNSDLIHGGLYPHPGGADRSQTGDRNAYYDHGAAQGGGLLLYCGGV